MQQCTSLPSRQNVRLIGDPSSADQPIRRDLSPSYRSKSRRQLARSVLKEWQSGDDLDDSRASRHAETFLKHSLRNKRRYARLMKDLDKMEKVFK